MTVAFLSHSDCGRHDTGWGHPEHVGRIRAIPRALREDPDLMKALLHAEGRHATEDELALVHEPAYIRAVRKLAQAGGGRLDADTVASEGSWDAATAGAGCVLDAVDMMMDGRAQRAFCAIRPPGHHALRDRAMGFCLFGNVAIATHYARSRHALERVLIVDWDVHHGNGTQALVEHERDVHFVSMHQSPWYPGTGVAADRGPYQNVWNVPMRASLPPQTYVDADGKLRHDLSTPEIRDVIQKGTGELWIDMRVTSRQCIAMLDNVFAFHPLAVEDALNPVSRVKVDEYPGFLFTIIRGVKLR